MSKARKAKARRATKPPRVKAKRTITRAAEPAPARARREHVIKVAGQPTRWPREIKLDKVMRRKDMGDLTGLAKSIDARGGLIQPVCIDPHDQLIAGQRRLAAWPLTRFRKEAIPVAVLDVDSILAGEWDENAQRKDFTPSESVALMDALLPEAKAKAKERQKTHGGTAPGRGAEEEHSEAGRAEDKIASFLGRDRKTIEHAKAVVDAAKAEPEKFGKLLEQMDRTGKVNGPFRRLQILRQVDDIKTKKANGKLDLPEGTFDRVVADYPWAHEPDDDTAAERGRATRDYPTMSTRQICAHMKEVARRLADDCTVYFWTTNFHMRYAYQALAAAGLSEVPTILTWRQDKMGRGQRLREQTEHCLIAIKGKPVWNLTSQTTLLDAPVRENSRKPDEFYALIDALTPAQRSLELFARRELPEGWDGFGDQVGKFKDKGANAIVNDAKAEKARARLRKRAAKLGHEITITFDGEDDGNRVRVIACGCGSVCRLPERENVEALTETAIDEHLREVVAAAPAARSEAADKTAKRGSRRAKRAPQDAASVAEAAE